MPDSRNQAAGPEVVLRDLVHADLPAIFGFQSDPDAIKMAVVFERSRAEFDQHWQRILKDQEVTVKAIIAEGVLVGHVSCFSMDSLDSVGYWIGKPHWGKGYATSAVQLLLKQVTTRPLHARVAKDNAASVRVLHKCGFVVLRHETSPDDGRFPVCEEVIMRLD